MLAESRALNKQNRAQNNGVSMSLIVTRQNGTSDITFTLQQTNGSQKTYINAAAGLAEPESIVMQSFLRPLGQKGTDRHVIRASKTFVEDTTGNHITTSAKLELVIPRSAESGLAQAFYDQVAFLKSLTSATILAAIVAGGLPDGDYHVDTFNPA
jgi:hypothetical protein